MDKKWIVVLSLLWLFSGCIHRPNSVNLDVYQRAIRYVQPFIDSGYIANDYIHLYEIVDNDSNSVFSVLDADAPNSGEPEYPSRIIKAGEKYFCFTELDEPELSVEQIYRITNVYYTNYAWNCNDFGYLAISKYKDAGIVVKHSHVDYLFDYFELWPYYSGGQFQTPDFYIWHDTHDIVLTDSTKLETDSLNYFIKKVVGSFYVRNKTNSTIVLSPDIFGRAFVIANGIDTLTLSLKKSLPLEIRANDYEFLCYESQVDSSFFQKLPCKQTWMSLRKLFSDSTYSVLRINGDPKPIRLLYNNYPFNYIRDDSGRILRKVWNEGVFDKDRRFKRFSFIPGDT